MYCRASVRRYGRSLCPLAPLMTHGAGGGGRGGGGEEEVFMYSVTSSLRHRYKSLGVREGEKKGANDHSSGWSLHDLTAKKHPDFYFF